jgi:hypothetical protein
MLRPYGYFWLASLKTAILFSEKMMVTARITSAGFLGKILMNEYNREKYSNESENFTN